MKQKSSEFFTADFQTEEQKEVLKSNFSSNEEVNYKVKTLPV